MIMKIKVLYEKSKLIIGFDFSKVSEKVSSIIMNDNISTIFNKKISKVNETQKPLEHHNLERINHRRYSALGETRMKKL
jgi:hypothetical protein